MCAVSGGHLLGNGPLSRVHALRRRQDQLARLGSLQRLLYRIRCRVGAVVRGVHGWSLHQLQRDGQRRVQRLPYRFLFGPQRFRVHAVLGRRTVADAVRIDLLALR